MLSMESIWDANRLMNSIPKDAKSEIKALIDAEKKFRIRSNPYVEINSKEYDEIALISVAGRGFKYLINADEGTACDYDGAVDESWYFDYEVDDCACEDVDIDEIDGDYIVSYKMDGVRKTKNVGSSFFEAIASALEIQSLF